MQETYKTKQDQPFTCLVGGKLGIWHFAFLSTLSFLEGGPLSVGDVLADCSFEAFSLGVVFFSSLFWDS